MKFYDENNKRLIMIEDKATPSHWDKHWEVNNFIQRVKLGRDNRLVKKFTERFLRKGSKVLEGGCGIGQNVYGLKNWGYDEYGVDYAKNTVNRIKNEFPELKIFNQDVRKLDFPNNFFDGYWSLGVIEHFWEGYDKVLVEMKRVIKPKGYLFLTFPYMSPLRKLKVKLDLYNKLNEEETDLNKFYQFILDENKVIEDFKKHKFNLILKYPYSATKGLKDEILLLNEPLAKAYNSQIIIAKGIRFLISFFLSKICSHGVLLVLQNNEE